MAASSPASCMSFMGLRRWCRPGECRPRLARQSFTPQLYPSFGYRRSQISASTVTSGRPQEYERPASRVDIVVHVSEKGVCRLSPQMHIPDKVCPTSLSSPGVEIFNCNSLCDCGRCTVRDANRFGIVGSLGIRGRSTRGARTFAQATISDRTHLDILGSLCGRRRRCLGIFCQRPRRCSMR